MLYFKLLILFIVLNIVNFIFLRSKNKLNKISLIISIISLLFSTSLIFIMNIQYNSLILKEFSDISEKQISFLQIVMDLNIFFGIISLLTTAIFCIISFKAKYELLYIITLRTLLILSIILFFYKGIIITKSVIDLSLLSWCLMLYYLNFSTIPLLLKKYRESIHTLNNK